MQKNPNNFSQLEGNYKVLPMSKNTCTIMFAPISERFLPELSKCQFSHKAENEIRNLSPRLPLCHGWSMREGNTCCLPCHPPCSCTRCAGKQQWSRCLKGKQALFGEYHQLWVAELQVRAGNRASGGCIEKVHEASSPRCFLPELKSLKCTMFYFEI